ncbi:unnamed protein product [Cyclocybe aegerita]|uniref:CoA-transferase family III n=1 Tax=Cyclocybe aegerita TaxID=1973307 RepID=A0A8S0WFI2_CYCAE|nr:unnamed protein product [Cyclocybe aegerita]
MLRPIPARHLVRTNSPFHQTIRLLSTPPPPPQSRPLDGITVVSLEQAIAAPFCTRQLADLGARVIKVERPPTGDFARAYDTRVKGLSSHFVWTNRGKESLALDLKNTHDLTVLKKLVGKADVLSMVEWMGFPLYYTYAGAPGPQLSGAAHAAIYPYGPFKTRDGEVMLGLQNEREWTRSCGGVLGCPELASDARFASNALRVKNRDALKVIIEEVFGSYSAQEVLARLDEAEISNARVNDMQGVWRHPQLEARKRWTQVRTEKGMVPALLPPGFVPEGEEGLSARMDGVPALGEHNEKILKELGEV